MAKIRQTDSLVKSKVIEFSRPEEKPAPSHQKNAIGETHQRLQEAVDKAFEVVYGLIGSAQALEKLLLQEEVGLPHRISSHLVQSLEALEELVSKACDESYELARLRAEGEGQ